MDLSWSLPPDARVNWSTPRDSYLGAPKKMQLPSAKDFAENVCKAGRGAWLYSADISQAYHQLPLDHLDWLHICFMEGSKYFTDVSLPFSMRCVASACQDTTSLVVQHLNQQGVTLLSYIDDYRGGGGSTKAHAQNHFGICRPSSPHSAWKKPNTRSQLPPSD